MLVKLRDAYVLRKLLERKQEDDIMREDDNLPFLGLVNQPPRYAMAPLEIE